MSQRNLITGAIATLTVLTVLAFGACTAVGAWDTIAKQASWEDTDWEYRMALRLRNGEQTESLENFPVLVVLNTERFTYGQAEPDGSDLRFFDAEQGVELYYEIERWDPAGDSYIWVLVPEVAPGNDGIWLYWGSEEPASGYQNAAKVWAEYELVYHFAELSGSSVLDSTMHGRDGNASETTGFIKSAAIGDGFRTLHSPKQYVDTNYHAATPPSAWTIETWTKADTAPQTDNVNGPIKGHSYYNLEWDHDTYPGGVVLNDGDGEGGFWNGWHGLTLGGTSLSADTWYYLAATYDAGSGSACAYRDGEKTDSVSGMSDALAKTSEDVFIGTEPNTNSVMNGVVDEVRISHVAHSAEWIRAQYLSMTDSFLGYGTPESLWDH